MIEKLEGRLLGFEALRMFSNPNGFQNTPEKSNNFLFYELLRKYSFLATFSFCATFAHSLQVAIYQNKK